jgi:hypothetical protein
VGGPRRWTSNQILDNHDATRNKKLSKSEHLRKHSFENGGPTKWGMSLDFTHAVERGPSGGISLHRFEGNRPGALTTLTGKFI